MPVNHSGKKIDCRVLASEIVAAVIGNQASLATLLPAGLERVQDKDRSLLQELCYGTLRHYYSLNGQVSQYLTKPLKEKDSDIFAVLLIGTYQLLHTRIPAYAAINSSVSAANILKKIWAKGLINAVLRNIQREMNKTDSAQEKKSRSDEINDQIHYDHPQWLINEIKKDHGEQAESIFMTNNTKAPMTLRVNQQQISRADYLEQLNAAAIKAMAASLSRHGIQLENAVDVSTLPLFDNGAASVQDESAQLTADLLKLNKDQLVLDACAAPGGKTCHMLEIEPSLKVTALDISEQRNHLIHDNLQRLKLSAQVIAADASKPEQWWKQHCKEQPFDRILLDAPCSATGVIRHHPDIKLLRQASDIPSLAKLQLKILLALWPLLKPDGILLYTTCSILNQENDNVIHKFLIATADAEIELIDASWGKATAHGRQLLPQINGHDGFYFARIKKSASRSE